MSACVLKLNKNVSVCIKLASDNNREHTCTAGLADQSLEQSWDRGKQAKEKQGTVTIVGNWYSTMNQLQSGALLWTQHVAFSMLIDPTPPVKLTQATPLHAGSLERLLEGQAKVRIAQREISAIRVTHTRPGHDAAHWGPFLLQGCWVSTAHFLQADAEQRPPPVILSGGQGRSGQAAEGETRSRRRRLPWRFLWPETAATAGAVGPSGSAHSGILFGRPLEAICSQDGALPQPIQDLLALLHEQGPSTEGIFRLAASERASRDIREALDTGAQVHLASQPVHVLAVILKDFLRKIPSKLLHSELYQQWMDALQKTSRQERLAGLRESSGMMIHLLRVNCIAIAFLSLTMLKATCFEPYKKPKPTTPRKATKAEVLKSLQVGNWYGTMNRLQSGALLWAQPVAFSMLIDQTAPVKLTQATPLHAGSLERLLEGQAKVRIAQREISAIRVTHTRPGHDAAHWGPFLLQGCWVSTAHFLQADAEQRPPPVILSGGQGRSGQAAEGETRSRRRRLPWRFLWPETAATAGAVGPSGSAHSGILFGRPLEAICSQDGALPQPIQDLLALLHEQGPSTEGIFRLAASERASRDIREALDTGAQVHLASQPVHVLAVILKDFLRKIPSKLLHSELYQQWMDALQKTSRQERLAGLRESSGMMIHLLRVNCIAIAFLSLTMLKATCFEPYKKPKPTTPRKATKAEVLKSLQVGNWYGTMNRLQSGALLWAQPVAFSMLIDQTAPVKLTQATPLHAGSLERLLEGQAKVRIAQREISAIRVTHTRPGHDAAHWGPFLLQGCWVSTAHFLQADAEQRPPPVILSGGQGRSGQAAEGETRSRRRRLPWRFLWPETAATAGAVGPSGSAHSGILFGRPLEAICSQDGALPQPIQDLLALLHEQGPSTEGIFRLAASERASRDIREALDTGAQVHLASQPVHVLAVILKDFLRKIPSKLLHSELYQQWMDALQKTSRQERLAGLRESSGMMIHLLRVNCIAIAFLSLTMLKATCFEPYKKPKPTTPRKATKAEVLKSLQVGNWYGTMNRLQSGALLWAQPVAFSMLIDQTAPVKLTQATPLHAGSLERLLEGQAKVRIAQREISAIRVTHTRPGHDAAHWGPFLLQGCWVSTAHFLQADAEQRPPPVILSGGQGRSGQAAEGETRSRRRRLPWRFLWPETAATAGAVGPSGSAHSGILFGRPLEAICSQDGALPQPIQDLLALLHEQGPSTEGIFRLAASERASRDIREALDTGAQVHLASQPVHVLAVILKDFLRKIPSKLLHSELYQQWMDALQKTSRQERLAGLRE
ncbi:hypothetical protein Q9233_003827 [Columba guinea]|nr:hypothetical protein Q9233_003827 [Columba guinea]